MRSVVQNRSFFFQETPVLLCDFQPLPYAIHSKYLTRPITSYTHTIKIITASLPFSLPLLKNILDCFYTEESPKLRNVRINVQDTLTLLIGIVRQDTYEEVDVITKGGNYGWRVYEGPYLFKPPQTPGGNTSLKSISPIFPIMGYTHSDVNKNEGSASITGGYIYRSKTDPCMYGR